jgi:transposase
MSKETLAKGLSQKGTSLNRSFRYFSEEARRQIVKEIEEGIYTKAESARVYKVAPASIYNWLDKYSLHYQKGMRTVVEIESESQKRKHLEQQVSDLQKVIGQQTLENFFYKQLLDVLHEHYDFDFKKNMSSMSSDSLEQIKKQLVKKGSI